MLAVVRIIDANINRAREALRVMEDAARFGLDDAALCEELKGCRHDLVSAAREIALPPGALIANRDTTGDVGTAIAGSGEYAREGLHGMAGAAGARLSEALRAIEEGCKALGDVPAAGKIERLRYRGYTAERRLMLALGSARRRQWCLCVLITEALCVHHPWREVVRSAIEGGADCLQLREKALESGELLSRARWMIETARPLGVAVVVNDRPDVALLAGADGVHVGQNDLAVHHVRRIVGTGMLIGVSTENLAQARAACAAGADYCGVGPMYATETKVKPRIAGAAYLREYLAEPGVRERPHLAIGGVTAENVGELADAGCRGVAVSSAVCGAGNPGEVAGAIRSTLDRTASPG